ncbi:helix-turn-helix domain-containing protein [Bradyrhizobium elkanii]|uniref:helix-turn-helix domain-containing protein n=1 Tax=Bradyrhizobium elkanii TaxID=29448 RepID=UPI0027145295|nr:helix-turn-helix transcriptional regulator [Bradyrhizobium elkanii]WLA99514.1 helix-turn-helix transcriptional regulator [Bradyrhizobium elkanii]
MRKVVPNGKAVKALREQLERLSTQKEMASEIGVSIRMLRMIENENAPIAVTTAERLAKALQVHRERIILGSELSEMTPTVSAPEVLSALMEDEDRLIPRNDYDIASATADEGALYTEAARSHDVACIIETTLDEETGAYAQELFDILVGLSWSQRDILVDIPPRRRSRFAGACDSSSSFSRATTSGFIEPRF